MSLYEAVLRPLLFRLDPETAHDLALGAVRRGFVKARPAVTAPRTLFGVTFPHPVGLAAGFDKNGVALARWKDLGFGFVEIGTVTRHAQPGNPKPRLFRLPADRALINRLGFNNEGADAVADRIEGVRAGIPVGINIGKSQVTELADAAEDYAYSFQRLRPFADYMVVNVSSPNTPGLRELQDRGPLTKILWRLREIDGSAPLFVKVAPDLTDEAVDDLVSLALDFDLTGLVATNTTLSRPLPADPGLEGGLSGAPLQPRADAVLDRIRRRAGDRLVLIGVGGIMDAEGAHRKLGLGADLLQVYTGWVYGGVDFAARLNTALATPLAPG